MKVNVEELRAALEATAKEIDSHQDCTGRSPEATYMRGFVAALCLLGIGATRKDGKLTVTASWIEE